MAGYDVGVRSALNQKGISNDRITYDPTKGVMVDQVSFLKPQKNYQGASYTDKSGFNSAWDNYQKGQNTQQVTPQPTNGYNQSTTGNTQPTTQSSPYNTNNPYDQKYNDMLGILMQQAQHPQQVDVNAIYNSPQYAAYQAQAQRGAQQGIRAAQESMGASGFGRSTALGERAQGIQNDANEYLNTQVLPQLMTQEQARQQQQYENQYNMLNQLMNQQGVYDNRFNNANQYALNKGELTGTFRDPQANSIINDILQLKQGYGGLQNADERAAATNQATALRSQLAAMGIDPAAFGANRTLEQAQSGLSGAGVKTLGAKNQDYNQMADKRNFDYGVGQDKIKNAQFEEEFQQRVAQDGIQNAISWANHALSAQDNALARDKFAYDKEQDKQNGGKPKNYNYETDPDFADDVQAVTNDPNLLAQIKSNSAAFIKKYGKDGYDALIEYGTPKKQSTTDLFSELFTGQ